MGNHKPARLLATLALPWLISTSSLAQENAVDQPTPPGFVEIPAGKAFVGTPTDRIKEHLEGKWGEVAPKALATETPGKSQTVEAFWIQNSEVTNRQFAEFVKQTGRKAPMHWADKAIKDARKAHVEREGEIAKEDPKYKPRPFDDHLWYEANWRDAPWAIPTGEEDFPVTNVSYRDCVAFCVWAGLRMPTEAEWTRAARADEKKEYIWGDEWDRRKCSNLEISRQKLQPIGSYPDSVSPFELYDMVGSVYEWTSSGFDKLPGYSQLTMTVKQGRKVSREKINPTFRPLDKVIKGGSYLVNDPRFACRLGHRLGVSPDNYSEQIGFRPARSTVAGLDHVKNLVEFTVPYELLGKNGEIDHEKVVGRESWMVRLGTGAAGAALPGAKEPIAVAKVPVPGYGVIVKHKTRLFAPVLRIPSLSPKSLVKDSLDNPIVLGLLSMTEECARLELPAGNYVVKYRAEGRPPKKKKDKKEDGEKDEKGAKKGKKDAKDPKADKKKEDEKKADEKEKEEVLKFDPKKENLLFFDAATGDLVKAVPSSTPPIKKYRKKSRKDIPVSSFAPHEGSKKEPTVERFLIALPTSSPNTWFQLTLDLDEIKN